MRCLSAARCTARQGTKSWALPIHRIRVVTWSPQNSPHQTNGDRIKRTL